MYQLKKNWKILFCSDTDCLVQRKDDPAEVVLEHAEEASCEKVQELKR